MFIEGLLRDSIWQFIGVIISFIGIIITITLTLILHVKQTHHKVITYQIDSNAPVVTINYSVSNTIKDNIEVYYRNGSDAKLINEVHLVVLKVFNSGNLPITIDDYKNGSGNNPLTFEFLSGTKILNIKVIEENPSNLNISVKPHADVNKVIIDPFLFKSKDYFIFRVLIDKHNNNDAIILNTRLSYVDIRKSNEAPSLPNQRLLNTLDICRNVTLLSCIIVCFVTIYKLDVANDMHIILYVIIMVITSVIFILMLLTTKYIRNFLENQNKA